VKYMLRNYIFNIIIKKTKHLLFGVLCFLFMNSLFAVDESGTVNINTGVYISRTTDITWTSGSINLGGGTLEIFGNFTINSGVSLNFNSNSTLIVHGTFTINSSLGINGTLVVYNNFVVNGSITNNSSGLVAVYGNLTTTSTIGSDGYMVVAGNLNTNGSSVTNNNDRIYVFGTSSCSGTGCATINSQRIICFRAKYPIQLRVLIVL
jgi:hypothetical protein